MENKVLKFKSKRDWLISLPYAVFILVVAIIWIIPYDSTNDLIFKILTTSVISILIGLFTWAVFSTYYLFGEKYLICVSGPFRSRVFYSEITDVKPSYSGWSSLALAFDRVVIIRGNNVLRRTYVSPKNKEAFIEEVKKRMVNSK